jgi:8-hydroxy-5-deazaflavin:NADPH oxidoreductase
LARRWQAAGHDVSALGREGGDATGSEALLVAVPSSAIEDAFDSVKGTAGIPAIDATNAYGGRQGGFESFTHQVKAHTNGPVSKAFNSNFASLFDEIDRQSAPPGQLYCGDEEAREVTEQLIRDAGFEPVRTGGLDNARALEDFLGLLMGIAQSLGGPYFYRFGRPGQL